MYNKEKQLEKCNDTDFCHNQITYLVVWPYCDMADNILPYFSGEGFEIRILLFDQISGTTVRRLYDFLAVSV